VSSHAQRIKEQHKKTLNASNVITCCKSSSNKTLKNKVKNLQQQLRRSKKKIGIIKSEIADRLHTSFDTLQLSIFHNAKNNTTISPTGRRYTDDIKEFASTLYFTPQKITNMFTP
jgi:2C-methyl-D-erythritol 2,4-cyclodiphosphate synthase